MFSVEKHFDLLGMKVRDRVSGYAGVVTSISFDLYGCVQAIVHPGLDNDGKLKDQNWFDVARLETMDENPVMDRPDYIYSVGAVAEGKKGPAEKPAFMKS